MIFLKGIVTGFILSLPFGPIGIHCMEKVISQNEKKAYVSTLGMVTVDILYGILAFLFINRLEVYVLKYDMYLKILIGLFLILIGYRKISERQKIKELEDNDLTLFQDYFEVFFLALFNISSILVIGGVYTLLGVTNHGEKELLKELTLGIGVGGAGTWAFTISVIHYYKKRLTFEILLKLTKMAGSIILIFGIGTIIFAFYK